MKAESLIWTVIIVVTFLGAIIFAFGAAPATKIRWHRCMHVWGGAVGLGFLIYQLGCSPAAWVALPLGAALVVSGYKRTTYCPRCGTARLGRDPGACKLCGTVFGNSGETAS